MSGNEIHNVAEAFASNFIAPVGPQLDEFENAVRDYLGQNVYCVGLASGSASLHLALRIAGVKPGDEVWISSMTFAGGVFPINYLGAIPVFFDIDPTSWTIDTELIGKHLSSAAKKGRLPKAIVPTDLYGQASNIEQLEKLAEHYGVNLIFDSAESLGARNKSRFAGSGGDASILSFNGNKIITTSGGGMLVTRHEAWADQARFLATQARDPAPHYEHTTFGYNYRLSNICAAIGLGQMTVLDERIRRRREIFERYKLELFREGLIFMPEAENGFSTRWLTTCKIDPNILKYSREDIRLKLLQHEIEARPLWKPMHLQPLYKGTTYHGTGYDEHLFEQGLCLPSGSDLTDDQQSEVIEIINSLLNKI